jgi:dipeptidyl aminopeptidase/acylaminoacyl peptidase
VSASEDGRFVLFRVRSDVQASSYYAYDREQKALSHLVDQHPELPAERMSPMQSIAYTARDGLRISGYLTLPNGRGGKNLPAIVLPHGGPFARDVRDWNAEVQFLASRGFAVLQPNFRGSSGFGRAFERSGYRQWGLAMQDDISDGVKWLVEQGIADPDRIGIYGASYGGYAALVGGTKTASLYRAAAAYAPVVDLELMIDDEASYRGYVPYAETQIGGELGDKERLRANSPLRLAEQAGVPILLGHGDEDDVVDVHHSRKMAAALRKAGKPFEYLEFPHEIHGFLLESNRIRWYEALAAFFEKHLAQRAANTAAAGAAP